MKRIFLAGAIALAAITSAHAASITGLKNTGLGASGSGDSNYKLTAASSDTTISSTVPVISYDSQWPINPWLANSSSSKWITPTASQSQSFDASSAGTYTYTLSFDLTGYNAASAAFTGRLAADNSVTIKLNNTVIGTATGFSDWTNFSADSGFVSGTNKLDFVVSNWAQNSGNPTGLRVEFATSSVMAAVPEPETYAMLLGGLAMLGAVARRRKQK
ncbi:FxDxF family PEP-CTERM protein [Duganella sp. sic0402]|uniref:FxDxF family PEP-CTERM protein n=1 Tax=Duganella sp. sic0402 TaxID=2854786 RepID=UPI001C455385|nr:FxDxF family PEP-CTERM protein [Duganella sp. sic0402]MBV7534628.1 FxDxF family PEP-CTERM protein [Duganella sp. sic0402]